MFDSWNGFKYSVNKNYVINPYLSLFRVVKLRVKIFPQTSRSLPGEKTQLVTSALQVNSSKLAPPSQSKTSGGNRLRLLFNSTSNGTIHNRDDDDQVDGEDDQGF